MDLKEFRKIKFGEGMAFMASDGRTRKLRGVDFETAELFDEDNVDYPVSDIVKIMGHGIPD